MSAPDQRDGIRPARVWKWTRRACQVLAFVAILIAPLLGGWQRLDRNYLSAWHGHGWDLPPTAFEQLPMGEAPGRAYELNMMLGGGTGVEYFSIPIVDPVAGALSLLTAPAFTFPVVAAWLLPILLALFGGRAFCGWFCPFGSLARGLEGVLERLPFRIPSFVPPRRRSLRFVVLALAVLAGAFGGELLLYLLLPHMLVQQTLYGVWLMGGGGAAVGALLGLVATGVVFGPTVYCASLCPTGAALSLVGRKRIVHLTLVDPKSCGARCDLCDRACWLFLHPSTGDPGPDCDNCARCVEVCPHTNLQVVARKPWHRPGVAAALLLGLALIPIGCVQRDAPDQSHKPRLVVEAHRNVDDVEVAVSVVDFREVRLDADDPTAMGIVEVSVYLARGDRGTPNRLGRLPERDYYQGPLRLRAHGPDGLDASVELDRPNFPYSTPRRSVYRIRLETGLRPGDTIEVGPVEGWLTDPATIEVETENPGASRLRAVGFAGGAFLLFGGLTALGLGLRRKDEAESPQRTLVKP